MENKATQTGEILYTTDNVMASVLAEYIGSMKQRIAQLIDENQTLKNMTAPKLDNEQMIPTANEETVNKPNN